MNEIPQKVSDSVRRRNPHLYGLSNRPAVPDTKQRQCPEALEVCDVGKAQSPGLLHCRFTLRRKSLLDIDAKYASVKDLLDCLVIAGIICGDKEGQITLEVNQFKVQKGEIETTKIEVLKL